MSKLTHAQCSWSPGGTRTTWGTGHTLRPAAVRDVWAPLGALGVPWGNEGSVTWDRVYPNPRPKAGTETSPCPAESEPSPPQCLEPCFPESVLSGDLEEKEKEGRGETNRDREMGRWGKERKEREWERWGRDKKGREGKGEEEEKEKGGKGEKWAREGRKEGIRGGERE